MSDDEYDFDLQLGRWAFRFFLVAVVFFGLVAFFGR